MPQRFDATLKDLAESYPSDWLTQLELPATGPLALVDADVSTVTAQADKVLRVGGPNPWLLHLELQASRDPELPRRLLRYNVLLYGRHGLPVHSAVVLLRPEADDPGLTGIVSYQAPHGRGGLEFRYQVLRVWKRPAETFLAGGLGTIPLAPLSDVPTATLPGVIHRMDERLMREAAPADAAKLWAATYILMGLRYPDDFAAELLKGVRTMKESTTYQAILAEGRAEGQAVEARKILLHLGGKRFGPPDVRTRTAIEAIADVERLEQLTERLLDVSSWEELLATP